MNERMGAKEVEWETGVEREGWGEGGVEVQPPPVLVLPSSNASPPPLVAEHWVTCL